MQENKNRHILIEEPDGHIIIGTNVDIEAPPVIENTQPISNPNIIIQYKIIYNKINIFILHTYLVLSLILMFTKLPIVYIFSINTCSLTLILIMIYSGKYTGMIFILLYSIICFILVPIMCSYGMWLEALYFNSLAINLSLTLYRCKTEFITYEN